MVQATPATPPNPPRGPGVRCPPPSGRNRAERQRDLRRERNAARRVARVDHRGRPSGSRPSGGPQQNQAPVFINRGTVTGPIYLGPAPQEPLRRPEGSRPSRWNHNYGRPQRR
ncbi:uncharacterized protein LOC141850800 [Brevipalpus obovatus]|uniref:uncharacterized protein LOC141850800 n=1 Tax=Brevipalpus obovatus TaxID=246614 RepID=UPI003D9DC5F8